MNIIILKITFPDKEIASQIIRQLLEEKLISSANYFPVTSTSAWSGEIVEVDEYIGFLKTKEDNWTILKNRLAELHPYKVPCIMKIETETNESYEEWVLKQTS